ncbi:MAG: DUF885 family protein [Gemmatimonadaceae bacterium]
MTLDAFFESYYRLRPVNATYTGVHDHDDRLPDWSPEGLDAAADEMRSLRRDLARAPAAHPAASDDERTFARVDRAIADAFLEIQIAETESGHFARGNPSLWAGEALFSVLSLMTRDFAPAGERIEAAAARLAAIPGFLASAARTIGSPAPADWVRRARRECEGAAILFGPGVDTWLDRARASDALASLARRHADSARRAFEAFDTWLAALPPAPPERYACGAEMLDLLLARGHWCTRSRAELLADVRERLDDALARHDEMARATAPGGWPEVQERLAVQHPRATDYYAAYGRVWEACRCEAEARELVTWIEHPIRYVPIPPETRDAAPYLYYLFYRSPAPFDRPAVHEYAVTPVEADMPASERERRLRANNDSVIKLNHVVHHGALGHHVQNAHARRSTSRIGQVAAVDCASRIGMFCGGTLAEGWACYATDLMEESGFLTELERVAEQHARARQLARAVVDLSLHAGEMTLDECTALYTDRVGMPAPAARAEAVKNSMFPGAAVMYWLGTQGIHDLRAERRAAEGERFTNRVFHDGVLRYGAIPVPLIARLVRGETLA